MLTKPPAKLAASMKANAKMAREFHEAAWSPNTRLAYAAQWATFTKWCAAQEPPLPSLPASEGTLVLFVSARAAEGIKPSSLAIALAAIGHAHEEAGLPSPRNHRRVKLTMAGIRRKVGTRPAQKTPLMSDQLRAIAKELPRTVIGTRDRALLLIGFAGGFRRSELASLRVEDITFEPQGLRVLIRRAKNDQEGKGREIAIPHGRARATCPVRSLEAWLDVAELKSGPLFRVLDRYGHLRGPLRGKDVALVLKRRVEEAGLDPTKFSGHSLRAGLASSAARAGRTAEVIAKTTGHSTSMVQRYVRAQALFENLAVAGLL